MLSPSTPSANKPPIFPSTEAKQGTSKLPLKPKAEAACVLRKDTDSSPCRDQDRLVRRRSGGNFNPNEAAPPRPQDLGRPHSVYRMENGAASR